MSLRAHAVRQRRGSQSATLAPRLRELQQRAALDIPAIARKVELPPPEPGAQRALLALSGVELQAQLDHKLTAEL